MLVFNSCVQSAQQQHWAVDANREERHMELVGAFGGVALFGALLLIVRRRNRDKPSIGTGPTAPLVLARAIAGLLVVGSLTAASLIALPVVYPRGALDNKNPLDHPNWGQLVLSVLFLGPLAIGLLVAALAINRTTERRMSRWPPLGDVALWVVVVSITAAVTYSLRA